MTIGDVLAKLGEPRDRSLIKPQILRYGSLELTFVEGSLVLAAVYLNRPEGTAEPGVDVDLPVSLEEIQGLLRDADAEFVPVEPLSSEGQSAFKVARSNAVLIFEDSQLNSVQVTVR